VSRVAIVTGGASGMGLATVERLRSQGVEVTSFDVQGERPVDVSDQAAVDAAVAEVRARSGPVDIVVNAAGVGVGGLLDGERYVEDWDRVLAVNLTGAMLVVRACIEDLAASGHGRIVNVASTEALSAQRFTGAYAVSKHGLLGFTRSIAVDYARTGLTSNCVCPGATDTPMVAGIPEKGRAEFARRHVPAGRWGTADEIAYVIVSLTALEASFVNGAVIAVDGGMTAAGP
jgi:3-oxoacyl-[acyl-carrier protein] reductase